MKSLPIKCGIAYIILDVIFWLFILISCLLAPVDTADILVFIPYVWYMPLVDWLNAVDVFPSFAGISGDASFFLQIAFLGVIGSVMHFLFGYVIGKGIEFFSTKPSDQR